MTEDTRPRPVLGDDGKLQLHEAGDESKVRLQTGDSKSVRKRDSGQAKKSRKKQSKEAPGAKSDVKTRHRIPRPIPHHKRSFSLDSSSCAYVTAASLPRHTDHDVTSLLNQKNDVTLTGTSSDNDVGRGDDADRLVRSRSYSGARPRLKRTSSIPTLKKIPSTGVPTASTKPSLEISPPTLQRSEDAPRHSEGSGESREVTVVVTDSREYPGEIGNVIDIVKDEAEPLESTKCVTKEKVSKSDTSKQKHHDKGLAKRDYLEHVERKREQSDTNKWEDKLSQSNKPKHKLSEEHTPTHKSKPKCIDPDTEDSKEGHLCTEKEEQSECISEGVKPKHSREDKETDTRPSDVETTKQVLQEKKSKHEYANRGKSKRGEEGQKKQKRSSSSSSSTEAAEKQKHKRSTQPRVDQRTDKNKRKQSPRGTITRTTATTTIAGTPSRFVQETSNGEEAVGAPGEETCLPGTPAPLQTTSDSRVHPGATAANSTDRRRREEPLSPTEAIKGNRVDTSTRATTATADIATVTTTSTTDLSHPTTDTSNITTTTATTTASSSIATAVTTTTTTKGSSLETCRIADDTLPVERERAAQVARPSLHDSAKKKKKKKKIQPSPSPPPPSPSESLKPSTALTANKTKPLPPPQLPSPTDSLNVSITTTTTTTTYAAEKTEPLQALSPLPSSPKSRCSLNPASPSSSPSSHEEGITEEVVDTGLAPSEESRDSAEVVHEPARNETTAVETSTKDAKTYANGCINSAENTETISGSDSSGSRSTAIKDGRGHEQSASVVVGTSSLLVGSQLYAGNEASEPGVVLEGDRNIGGCGPRALVSDGVITVQPVPNRSAHAPLATRAKTGLGAETGVGATTTVVGAVAGVEEEDETLALATEGSLDCHLSRTESLALTASSITEEVCQSADSLPSCLYQHKHSATENGSSSVSVFKEVSPERSSFTAQGDSHGTLTSDTSEKTATKSSEATPRKEEAVGRISEGASVTSDLGDRGGVVSKGRSDGDGKEERTVVGVSPPDPFTTCGGRGVVCGHPTLHPIPETPHPTLAAPQLSSHAHPQKSADSIPTPFDETNIKSSSTQRGIPASEKPHPAQLTQNLQSSRKEEIVNKIEQTDNLFLDVSVDNGSTITENNVIIKTDDQAVDVSVNARRLSLNSEKRKTKECSDTRRKREEKVKGKSKSEALEKAAVLDNVSGNRGPLDNLPTRARDCQLISAERNSWRSGESGSGSEDCSVSVHRYDEGTSRCDTRVTPASPRQAQLDDGPCRLSSALVSPQHPASTDSPGLRDKRKKHPANGHNDDFVGVQNAELNSELKSTAAELSSMTETVPKSKSTLKQSRSLDTRLSTASRDLNLDTSEPSPRSVGAKAALAACRRTRIPRRRTQSGSGQDSDKTNPIFDEYTARPGPPKQVTRDRFGACGSGSLSHAPGVPSSVCGDEEVSVEELGGGNASAVHDEKIPVGTGAEKASVVPDQVVSVGSNESRSCGSSESDNRVFNQETDDVLRASEGEFDQETLPGVSVEPDVTHQENTTRESCVEGSYDNDLTEIVDLTETGEKNVELSRNTACVEGTNIIASLDLEIKEDDHSSISIIGTDSNPYVGTAESNGRISSTVSTPTSDNVDNYLPTICVDTDIDAGYVALPARILDSNRGALREGESMETEARHATRQTTSTFASLPASFVDSGNIKEHSKAGATVKVASSPATTPSSAVTSTLTSTLTSGVRASRKSQLMSPPSRKKGGGGGGASKENHFGSSLRRNDGVPSAVVGVGGGIDGEVPTSRASRGRSATKSGVGRDITTKPATTVTSSKGRHDVIRTADNDVTTTSSSRKQQDSTSSRKPVAQKVSSTKAATSRGSTTGRKDPGVGVNRAVTVVVTDRVHPPTDRRSVSPKHKLSKEIENRKQKSASPQCTTRAPHDVSEKMTSDDTSQLSSKDDSPNTFCKKMGVKRDGAGVERNEKSDYKELQSPEETEKMDSPTKETKDTVDEDSNQKPSSKTAETKPDASRRGVSKVSGSTLKVQTSKLPKRSTETLSEKKSESSQLRSTSSSATRTSSSKVTLAKSASAVGAQRRSSSSLSTSRLGIRKTSSPDSDASSSTSDISRSSRSSLFSSTSSSRLKAKDVKGKTSEKTTKSLGSEKAKATKSKSVTSSSKIVTSRDTSRGLKKTRSPSTFSEDSVSVHDSSVDSHLEEENIKATISSATNLRSQKTTKKEASSQIVCHVALEKAPVDTSELKGQSSQEAIATKEGKQLRSSSLAKAKKSLPQSEAKPAASRCKGEPGSSVSARGVTSAKRVAPAPEKQKRGSSQKVPATDHAQPTRKLSSSSTSSSRSSVLTRSSAARQVAKAADQQKAEKRGKKTAEVEAKAAAASDPRRSAKARDTRQSKQNVASSLSASDLSDASLALPETGEGAQLGERGADDETNLREKMAPTLEPPPFAPDMADAITPELSDATADVLKEAGVLAEGKLGSDGGETNLGTELDEEISNAPHLSSEPPCGSVESSLINKSGPSQLGVGYTGEREDQTDTLEGTEGEEKAGAREGVVSSKVENGSESTSTETVTDVFTLAASGDVIRKGEGARIGGEGDNDRREGESGGGGMYRCEGISDYRQPPSASGADPSPCLPPLASDVHRAVETADASPHSSQLLSESCGAEREQNVTVGPGHAVLSATGQSDSPSLLPHGSESSETDNSVPRSDVDGIEECSVPSEPSSVHSKNTVKTLPTSEDIGIVSADEPCVSGAHNKDLPCGDEYQQHEQKQEHYSSLAKEEALGSTGEHEGVRKTEATESREKEEKQGDNDGRSLLQPSSTGAAAATQDVSLPPLEEEERRDSFPPPHHHHHLSSSASEGLEDKGILYEVEGASESKSDKRGPLQRGITRSDGQGRGVLTVKTCRRPGQEEEGSPTRHEHSPSKSPSPLREYEHDELSCSPSSSKTNKSVVSAVSESSEAKAVSELPDVVDTAAMKEETQTIEKCGDGEDSPLVIRKPGSAQEQHQKTVIPRDDDKCDFSVTESEDTADVMLADSVLDDGVTQLTVLQVRTSDGHQTGELLKVFTQDPDFEGLGLSASLPSQAVNGECGSKQTLSSSSSSSKTSLPSSSAQGPGKDSSVSRVLRRPASSRTPTSVRQRMTSSHPPLLSAPRSTSLPTRQRPKSSPCIPSRYPGPARMTSSQRSSAMTSLRPTMSLASTSRPSRGVFSHGRPLRLPGGPSHPRPLHPSLPHPRPALEGGGRREGLASVLPADTALPAEEPWTHFPAGNAAAMGSACLSEQQDAGEERANGLTDIADDTEVLSLSSAILREEATPPPEMTSAVNGSIAASSVVPRRPQSAATTTATNLVPSSNSVPVSSPLSVVVSAGDGDGDNVGDAAVEYSGDDATPVGVRSCSSASPSPSPEMFSTPVGTLSPDLFATPCVDFHDPDMPSSLDLSNDESSFVPNSQWDTPRSTRGVFVSNKLTVDSVGFNGYDTCDVQAIDGILDSDINGQCVQTEMFENEQEEETESEQTAFSVSESLQKEEEEDEIETLCSVGEDVSALIETETLSEDNKRHSNVDNEDSAGEAPIRDEEEDEDGGIVARDAATESGSPCRTVDDATPAERVALEARSAAGTVYPLGPVGSVARVDASAATVPLASHGATCPLPAASQSAEASPPCHGLVTNVRESGSAPLVSASLPAESTALPSSSSSSSGVDGVGVASTPVAAADTVVVDVPVSGSSVPVSCCAGLKSDVSHSLSHHFSATHLSRLRQTHGHPTGPWSKQQQEEQEGYLQTQQRQQQQPSNDVAKNGEGEVGDQAKHNLALHDKPSQVQHTRISPLANARPADRYDVTALQLHRPLSPADSCTSLTDSGSGDVGVLSSRLLMEVCDTQADLTPRLYHRDSMSTSASSGEMIFSSSSSFSSLPCKDVIQSETREEEGESGWVAASSSSDPTDVMMTSHVAETFSTVVQLSVGRGGHCSTVTGTTAADVIYCRSLDTDVTQVVSSEQSGSSYCVRSTVESASVPGADDKGLVPIFVSLGGFTSAKGREEEAERGPLKSMSDDDTKALRVSAVTTCDVSTSNSAVTSSKVDDVKVGEAGVKNKLSSRKVGTTKIKATSTCVQTLARITQEEHPGKAAKKPPQPVTLTSVRDSVMKFETSSRGGARASARQTASGTAPPSKRASSLSSSRSSGASSIGVKTSTTGVAGKTNLRPPSCSKTEVNSTSKQSSSSSISKSVTKTTPTSTATTLTSAAKKPVLASPSISSTDTNVESLSNVKIKVEECSSEMQARTDSKVEQEEIRIQAKAVISKTDKDSSSQESRKADNSENTAVAAWQNETNSEKKDEDKKKTGGEGGKESEKITARQGAKIACVELEMGISDRASGEVGKDGIAAHTSAVATDKLTTSGIEVPAVATAATTAGHAYGMTMGKTSEEVDVAASISDRSDSLFHQTGSSSVHADSNESADALITSSGSDGFGTQAESKKKEGDALTPAVVTNVDGDPITDLADVSDTQRSLGMPGAYSENATRATCATEPSADSEHEHRDTNHGVEFALQNKDNISSANTPHQDIAPVEDTTGPGAREADVSKPYDPYRDATLTPHSAVAADYVTPGRASGQAVIKDTAYSSLPSSPLPSSTPSPSHVPASPSRGSHHDEEEEEAGQEPTLESRSGESVSVCDAETEGPRPVSVTQQGAQPSPLPTQSSEQPGDEKGEKVDASRACAVGAGVPFPASPNDTQTARGHVAACEPETTDQQHDTPVPDPRHHARLAATTTNGPHALSSSEPASSLPSLVAASGSTDSSSPGADPDAGKPDQESDASEKRKGSNRVNMKTKGKQQPQQSASAAVQPESRKPGGRVARVAQAKTKSPSPTPVKANAINRTSSLKREGSLKKESSLKSKPTKDSSPASPRRKSLPAKTPSASKAKTPSSNSLNQPSTVAVSKTSTPRGSKNAEDARPLRTTLAENARRSPKECGATFQPEDREGVTTVGAAKNESGRTDSDGHLAEAVEETAAVSPSLSEGEDADEKQATKDEAKNVMSTRTVLSEESQSIESCETVKFAPEEEPGNTRAEALIKMPAYSVTGTSDPVSVHLALEDDERATAENPIKVTAHVLEMKSREDEKERATDDDRHTKTCEFAADGENFVSVQLTQPTAKPPSDSETWDGIVPAGEEDAKTKPSVEIKDTFKDIADANAEAAEQEQRSVDSPKEDMAPVLMSKLKEQKGPTADKEDKREETIVDKESSTIADRGTENDRESDDVDDPSRRTQNANGQKVVAKWKKLIRTSRVANLKETLTSKLYAPAARASSVSPPPAPVSPLPPRRYKWSRDGGIWKKIYLTDSTQDLTSLDDVHSSDVTSYYSDVDAASSMEVSGMSSSVASEKAEDDDKTAKGENEVDDDSKSPPVEFPCVLAMSKKFESEGEKQLKATKVRTRRAESKAKTEENKKEGEDHIQDKSSHSFDTQVSDRANVNKAQLLDTIVKQDSNLDEGEAEVAIGTLSAIKVRDSENERGNQLMSSEYAKKPSGVASFVASEKTVCDTSLTDQLSQLQSGGSNNDNEQCQRPEAAVVREGVSASSSSPSSKTDTNSTHKVSAVTAEPDTTAINATTTPTHSSDSASSSNLSSFDSQPSLAGERRRGEHHGGKGREPVVEEPRSHQSEETRKETITLKEVADSTTEEAMAVAGVSGVVESGVDSDCHSTAHLRQELPTTTATPSVHEGSGDSVKTLARPLLPPPVLAKPNRTESTHLGNRIAMVTATTADSLSRCAYNTNNSAGTSDVGGGGGGDDGGGGGGISHDDKHTKGKTHVEVTTALSARQSGEGCVSAAALPALGGERGKTSHVLDPNSEPRVARAEQVEDVREKNEVLATTSGCLQPSAPSDRDPMEEEDEVESKAREERGREVRSHSLHDKEADVVSRDGGSGASGNEGASSCATEAVLVSSSGGANRESRLQDSPDRARAKEAGANANVGCRSPGSTRLSEGLRRFQKSRETPWGQQYAQRGVTFPPGNVAAASNWRLLVSKVTATTKVKVDKEPIGEQVKLTSSSSTSNLDVATATPGERRPQTDKSSAVPGSDVDSDSLKGDHSNNKEKELEPVSTQEDSRESVQEEKKDATASTSAASTSADTCIETTFSETVYETVIPSRSSGSPIRSPRRTPERSTPVLSKKVSAKDGDDLNTMPAAADVQEKLLSSVSSSLSTPSKNRLTSKLKRQDGQSKIGDQTMDDDPASTPVPKVVTFVSGSDLPPSARSVEAASTATGDVSGVPTSSSVTSSSSLLSSPERSSRGGTSAKLISMTVWDTHDGDRTLRASSSARRVFWDLDNKELLAGISEHEEQGCSHDDHRSGAAPSDNLPSSPSSPTPSLHTRSLQATPEKQRGAGGVTGDAGSRGERDVTSTGSFRRRRGTRRSLSLPTGSLSYGDVKISYKDGHFVTEPSFSGQGEDSRRQRGGEGTDAAAEEYGSSRDLDLGQERMRRESAGGALGGGVGGQGRGGVKVGGAQGEMREEILSLLQRGFSTEDITWLFSRYLDHNSNHLHNNSSGGGRDLSSPSPSSGGGVEAQRCQSRSTQSLNAPGLYTSHSLPRRRPSADSRHRPVSLLDAQLWQHLSQSEQSLLYRSRGHEERRRGEEEEDGEDLEDYEDEEDIMIKRTESFYSAMSAPVVPGGPRVRRQGVAKKEGPRILRVNSEDGGQDRERNRSQRLGFIQRMLQKRKSFHDKAADGGSRAAKEDASRKEGAKDSSTASRKVSIKSIFRRRANTSTSSSPRKDSSSSVPGEDPSLSSSSSYNPPIAAFLNNDDIGSVTSLPGSPICVKSNRKGSLQSQSGDYNYALAPSGDYGRDLVDSSYYSAVSPGSSSYHHNSSSCSSSSQSSQGAVSRQRGSRPLPHPDGSYSGDSGGGGGAGRLGGGGYRNSGRRRSSSSRGSSSGSSGYSYERDSGEYSSCELDVVAMATGGGGSSDCRSSVDTLTACSLSSTSPSPAPSLASSTLTLEGEAAAYLHSYLEEGDDEEEGDVTLLASPGSRDRNRTSSADRTASSRSYYNSGGGGGSGGGSRKTSVERPDVDRLGSLVVGVGGADIASSNSNDSGIQHDAGPSSSESLRIPPELASQLSGSAVRLRNSPSPKQERPKSDFSVRWADLLEQVRETDAIHGNDGSSARRRPRPKSDLAADSAEDEGLDYDSTSSEEGGSSLLADSSLLRALGASSGSLTQGFLPVGSGLGSLHQYDSLVSLVELRRPANRGRLDTAAIQAAKLAKARRMSTPQPIKTRVEKLTPRCHRDACLVRSHSMPDNLDRLHRKKNYFSLIGCDVQSVYSHTSGGDDSSDESEFSVDYQQEKSLSTRASRVTLATIDQMIEEENLTYAEALWDHVTMDPDELGFRAGDLIRVTDTADKHWWYGATEHRDGWFPAAFVRVNIPIPTVV